MAKPDLGTKRICGECGGRFYDLKRDPIVCPKCGTVFIVVALELSSRAKAAQAKQASAKAAPAKAEETKDEANEQDDALVPLEDADAEENATGRAGKETGTDSDEGDDDSDGDDIPDVPDVDDAEDSDDENSDDDKFLDDDDDDDDVSGLIEGDIKRDDET